MKSSLHPLFAVLALSTLLSAVSPARAQVTVLAKGLNSSGNVLVDNTNVYWTEEPDPNVSGFPARIGSISKSSSGAATINYNYKGDPVYSTGSDFTQDATFLYYPGRSFDGTYYYPAICKIAKAGGASSSISPRKSPFWTSYGANALALSPAGGGIYYSSGNQAPNDRDDTFNTMVSLSTIGGNESILTYSSYGWGPGGSYTISNTTYYYGLAALAYNKQQNSSFSYAPFRGTNSVSTDATNLYWSDGDSIWRMPLIGGTPTAIVSGGGQAIYTIITPSSGAAAGSVFWLQTKGGSSSIMRRDSAGQVTTLLGPNTNMYQFYRCFAVSGDKVFAGSTEGLVQVSINGGPVTVLVPYTFPIGTPVSVAVDETNIYWSAANQIMRVARPSATPPVYLGNISTRLKVEAGDNTLIAGFIVTGPVGATKKVLIRGLGPSLTQFGVPGALADPFLELHDGSGAMLVSNNNWQAGDTSQIPDNFKARLDPLDSVIVATLTVGNTGATSYTAILKGANGETGVALAEVYDIETTSLATLGNVSTRGFVQQNDNVMIGGFIVSGSANQKVVIRALGPTLASFGISNPLVNPLLELHDANGTLMVANDNWKDTQGAEIQASGFAPPNNSESAILTSLPPAGYTAIVRGVANTVGVGLVEVYRLP